MEHPPSLPPVPPPHPPQHHPNKLEALIQKLEHLKHIDRAWSGVKNVLESCSRVGRVWANRRLLLLFSSVSNRELWVVVFFSPRQTCCSHWEAKKHQLVVVIWLPTKKAALLVKRCTSDPVLSISTSRSFLSVRFQMWLYVAENNPAVHFFIINFFPFLMLPLHSRFFISL